MPTLFSRITAIAPSPPSRLSNAFPRVRRLLRAVASAASSSSSSPTPTLPNISTSSVNRGGSLPRGALELQAMEAGVGPWSFALSWYCIGLVIMTILFNRIPHIVRPPSPHLARLQFLAQQRGAARLAAAHRSTWPEEHVDPSTSTSSPPGPTEPFRVRLAALRRRAFTSQRTRQLLRLPSAIWLAIILVQWGIILLQTSGLVTTCGRPGSWIAAGWELVRRKEMESLCWQTFKAVCLALATGCIGRGLEGRSDRGTGFNLVGYAFFLHFYSSPITHVHPAKPATGAVSRPDTNVLFGLALALLELTWLHTAELSRKWGIRRLLPTTVCALLGLVQFGATLVTAPSRLPSFTLVGNCLSLLLILIVAVTAGLTCLTQLLTLGRIDWNQLLPHESVALPGWDEEFSVALLRLATACMESSKLGGMGNELALIEVPRESFVDLKPTTTMTTTPSADPRPFQEIKLYHASPARGFANQIQKIVSPNPSPSNTFTPPSGASSHSISTTAPYARFARACARALARLAWFALGWVPGGRNVVFKLGVEVPRRIGTRWRGRPRWSWRQFRWTPTPPAAGIAEEENESTEASIEDPHNGRLFSQATSRPPEDDDELEKDDEDEEENAWTRFVLGRTYAPAEDLSEDDDPTFSPLSWSRPRSTSTSSSSTASSSKEEGDEDEEMSDAEADRLATYTDLLCSSTSASQQLPPAPELLLAHLASPSALTRARYRAHASGFDAFEAAVLSCRRGRASAAAAENETDGAEWDRERRRNCVVCVTEPREVVLWPCACLALCEDCRSNLAARVGTGQHQCPCCRTKVEGYSRIFLP